MDTNTATTKRLLTGNGELKKKIAVLNASIDPIEAENLIVRESIAKVSKQITQLTLLVEKLKLPPPGAAESSSSGVRGANASIEGDNS